MLLFQSWFCVVWWSRHYPILDLKKNRWVDCPFTITLWSEAVRGSELYQEQQRSRLWHKDFNLPSDLSLVALGLCQAHCAFTVLATHNSQHCRLCSWNRAFLTYLPAEEGGSRRFTEYILLLPRAEAGLGKELLVLWRLFGFIRLLTITFHKIVIL